MATVRHGRIRKRAYPVGTGRRRTKGYYSTEAREGTWYQKSGGNRGRTRHRGGRRTVTTYNRTVGRKTAGGGIVAGMVRAFKRWLR